MQLPPSADINTSEAGPITADEDFRKGECKYRGKVISFRFCFKYKWKLNE